MSEPNTATFLQQVLGSKHGLDGFVRFVLIDPEKGWGQKESSWQPSTFIAQVGSGASVDQVVGREVGERNVFFTPHLFERMDPHSRVTKEDVAQEGVCAWVECDDVDLDPSTFSPPPTYIVSTSPRRHHLYWVLEKPVPLQEIQKLNWRLIQGNGVKEDRGGWHLVKFLRLPGTRSYKRDIPHPVHIIDGGWHPERTYDFYRDFDMLPAYPENNEGVSSDIDEAGERDKYPPVLTEEQRLEYFDTLELSQEIRDLLTDEKSDRSAALWRIYGSCLRNGIEPMNIFRVVQGSPNDKFAKEWRYGAQHGLWHDIQRAVRVYASSGLSAIVQKIREIETTRGLPANQKRVMVADTIYRDLEQNGRIFFDRATYDAVYLNKANDELSALGSEFVRVVPINETEPAWRVLFTNRYGISKGMSEYSAVNELIYTKAGSLGEPIKPHQFAHYDRARKMLYIHGGGRYMYRLDGESVVQLDNGDEGVLFRDRPGLVPFFPDLDVANGVVQPEWGSPSLDDALWRIPNYTSTGGMTPEESAQLARIWTYCLFFPELMAARPHLVITGPTSSGKTMFFQMLSELFYGPESKVQSVPGDAKEFESAATNYHCVFYDNVDTPNKWFTDAIAEVATGIQYARRILYTTNSNVQYKAQCFLGMTTRDPWFSRTDVATRLIVLEVERREKMADPNELSDVVAQNRSVLWAKMFQDLNKVVKHLQTYGEYDSGHEAAMRMAGFERMVRIVAGFDDKVVPERLVTAITDAQAEATRDHSALWQALVSWLGEVDGSGNPRNIGRKVKAKELHNSLRYHAGDGGFLTRYEKSVGSTRSLGRQLVEMMPEIRKAYDVVSDSSSGSMAYTFYPKGQGPAPED